MTSRHARTEGLIGSTFGTGSIYQSLDSHEPVSQSIDGSFIPRNTRHVADVPEADEEMQIGVSSAPGTSKMNGNIVNSDEDSASEDEQPAHMAVQMPDQLSDTHQMWQHNKDSDEDEEAANLLLEPGSKPSKPDRGERLRRGSATVGNGISRGIDHLTHLRTRTSSRIRKGERHNAPKMLDVLDAKERAYWKWSNVENMDIFLQEIYAYFLGNGMYCIILSRIVNMATILFVVGFSTYLYSCIDYSKIRTSSSLDQVQVPRCMAKISGFHKFLLWVTALFWFLKLFQYVQDVRRLQDVKDFYWHLLDISDAEMQTISWQQITIRFNKLKTSNMAALRSHGTSRAKRLDAHDIANRIMRKENYMIALINKDVMDLRIPLPYLKNFRHFYTGALEWNIGLCAMDFVFNSQGQLRPIFLKEQHRRVLSEGLRRRFIFAGCMNILCAPFIIVYLTLLYFFRYFNEYHKDPSAIGTRQYSPYAEWRMREYNELYHLFQRRLNLSYLPASRYVNQFPKEMSVIFFRFVAFVAGSFAAVLGIISLIDPELFLGFEITKDRTVLFYIGIFGTILAVSRGMIPAETFVFDPESSMKYVAEFTHYMPTEWEGKLHSEYVKKEFSKLYQLRIVLLLKELASVITVPFVLFFSLSKSSEKIVDFFRENSVHVDGLGYVCSFAVFNFDNTRNRPFARDKDETADGKMMKSYFNFLDHYSESGQYNHAHHAALRQPAPQDDLEHSVMGRYNKWRGKPHWNPGLHGSMNQGFQSYNIQKLDDTRDAVPLVERDDAGEFESALREDPEEDTALFDNDQGGVLGLLNEFYKHSNRNG